MNEIVSWLHDRFVVFYENIYNWIYGDGTHDGHGLAIIGILAIGMIMYYLGGRVLARIVKRTVRTTHQRHWQRKDIEKRQETLVELFKNVWRILIFIVILYALLKEVLPNADALLTPLFASAGIIGVALGFGAQSIIKDFLSGIFIISENQYRVGDIVDIEGASGTVERIGTRSTVIRDIDGNVHYFPNGMVMHVINKTMGYSMARFIVGIHPSAELDKVIKTIDKLGKKLANEEKWKSKIIEPPAFVSVGEITGTAIEVIVAGKTQPSDQWAVIAEMRRRLLEALERQGIQLAVLPAFPTAQKDKK